MNEENKTEETLLTKTEAAKFLGISPVSLWRKRDSIKCYRIGRRVFFSKEKHLLPFLEKSEESYELTN